MDFTLLAVPLVAVLTPLIAGLVGRAVVVPLLAFDIVLGILIGPAALGWAHDSVMLETLSQLGLAMLFFMAGKEIDLASLRGTTGKRALGGWVLSAVIAVVAAALITDSVQALVVIAIALTGTALGSIAPIMRDAGLNQGALGRSISAAGAIGEFLPLVAITLLLSGQSPWIGAITLLVFVAGVGFAFLTATRREQPWLVRAVVSTLHTSGQFVIRLVVFLLAALTTLALVLGVDFLLGAFTAGLLTRVVLRDVPAEAREAIETKLEAVSFGFFVPVFFVTTGVTFPVAALFTSPQTFLMVPVFTLIILITRGIPGYIGPARGTSISDRRTSALFTATSLPLIVAVTQIGTDTGVLNESIASAMVGGGLLTVLLFPALGLVGRARATGSTTAALAEVDLAEPHATRGEREHE